MSKKVTMLPPARFLLGLTGLMIPGLGFILGFVAAAFVGGFGGTDLNWEIVFGFVYVFIAGPFYYAESLGLNPWIFGLPVSILIVIWVLISPWLMMSSKSSEGE